MVDLSKKILAHFPKAEVLPNVSIFIMDTLIVFAGGYWGTYLQFGGLVFAQRFWQFTLGLCVCAGCFWISFFCHHTYKGIIRYSTFVDLGRCLYATATGTILTFLCGWLIDRCGLFGGYVRMPGPKVITVIFLFSTVFIWAERIVVKSLFDILRKGGTVEKVVIYGTMQGGIAIAQGISGLTSGKFSLAGFICPEGDVSPGKYVMGVRVMLESEVIVSDLYREGVRGLIVSPIKVDCFRANTKLVNALIEAGIRIRMISRVEEWDGKSPLHQNQFREIEIDDLLQREKINVNAEGIRSNLEGKKILITGAAGSIGSEMTRQVASCRPAEMVLIDSAETPMHDIRLMMRDCFPEVKATTIVASITEKEHMERIFSDHCPDYVFHAAAYKHVPMMEDNPAEAVRNNIHGTRIIADLAVKYGVRKFVMISTDKAVNPTNVMGCSKRICEIYCQSLNKAIVDGRVKGDTQFVTTRFGNVLGSNGSVIPLFKEQIRRGGPVTVTHPEVIRYFMLISEACQLVLEAAAIGHGGEIFAFDMGKPVKILDLARQMITMSGAEDVEIVFTGLRDGEKLYEEVLSDKEKSIPTENPKIVVAKVREYDYETAAANEERLVKTAAGFDREEIVRLMKEVVPEYSICETLS